MTLQTSGPISLADIQTEFGGSNPIGLNEYYKGGIYVPANAFALNVPTNGVISLNNFYGAKKTSFQSVTFLSSTTWTVPATLVGNLNVYVIGGGGGGGNTSDYWGGLGGNGGSGGIASQSVSVVAGSSQTITVGGGGAAGYFGYGYPNNPYADGYPGGGGGQSSALGVIAGGGGGGGGGDPGFTGGAGGGSYGGAGGAGYSGTPPPATGSNGSGTGNFLSWAGNPSYGAAGVHSGYYSTCTCGCLNYFFTHTPSSAGTSGVIVIQGYW